MTTYFKQLIADLLQSIQILFSTIGWPAKLVIAAITFYAPVNLYAISILGLIIINVITGTWASYIKNQPFKSRILRKGLLEKMAVYGMLFTGNNHLRQCIPIRSSLSNIVHCMGFHFIDFCV